MSSSPATPTAMLPPIMKAIPPNIRFSVSSGRLPMWARISATSRCRTPSPTMLRRIGCGRLDDLFEVGEGHGEVGLPHLGQLLSHGRVERLEARLPAKTRKLTSTPTWLRPTERFDQRAFSPPGVSIGLSTQPTQITRNAGEPRGLG